MNDFPWGSNETQYFFELTPDKILRAVEKMGVYCTGRCLTLNSMENRVFEVEIEIDEDKKHLIKSPSDKFRIVKFYRPGRWSQEQIQEEHDFLLDLVEKEVPAIAPLKFPDGSTLQNAEGLNIWYSVFPKAGGQNPDELTDDQLAWLGRLLGRMHQVGRKQEAKHRLELTPQTYGVQNLSMLLQMKVIPSDIQANFVATCEAFIKKCETLFESVSLQRIHGDCHLGNIVWGTAGPFFVDFDDMVRGPRVQDMWLMMPGRYEDNRPQWEVFLEGYEQFEPFDRKEIKLIEALRGLRFIHFATWIARRWKDPAFPRSFPQFESQRYWEDLLNDVKEQLSLI